MSRRVKAAKTVSLILALALTAAFFGGCMTEDSYTPELPVSYDKPPAPSEDAGAQGRFDAKLYYISEDGLKLAPEERTVLCEEGEGMAFSTIKALMTGPNSPTSRRSVPSRLKLDKVEETMGICNVYLSGGFPSSENDWLIARLAIAATLGDTIGARAVNVFYNGKEQGYNNRPIGEARYSGESVDAYISAMEEAYGKRMGSGEAGKYISQSVTLYFTNVEKTLIAAQSADITVSADASVMELVEVLTAKLAGGVSSEHALEPVLPADFMLCEEPRISVFGESSDPDSSSSSLPLYAPKIIELTITPPAMEYDQRIMCAALTMTLTGYLPGISGIKLYILNDDGTKQQLYPDMDYLSRDTYTDMLGTSISVDYPDENGLMLKKGSKIVYSSEQYDLAVRLRALLEANNESGTDIAGLTADDINRIYLVDSTAVIDWKEGFTKKLRDALGGDASAAGDREELLMIYSIINTLTELPYVRRVWMSEQGQKLGMINRIYLGNPLLRSPGLIGSN